MEKLITGVIGTGNMGANHVRVLKSLINRCELIGVYDADVQRCRQVAERFQTKAYGDMDALLDDSDAAVIAVPTEYHYETAKKALDKGVHILIEKPIAKNTEQGKALVRLAEKKDLVLQVGHVERYNPAIQLLPEILADRKVIALEFKRMSPYNPRISDTDVVLDLMIHDIDVLSFLLPKEILKIEAMGVSPKSAGYTDYAVAHLLLEGGIVSTLFASRTTEQKIRTLSVTAEDAYIELDYIERKITISRATQVGFGFGKSSSYRQESVIEKVLVPNVEPLAAELDDFLSSVLHHQKPSVSGEDGLRALITANRIQQKIYGSV